MLSVAPFAPPLEGCAKCDRSFLIVLTDCFPVSLCEARLDVLAKQDGRSVEDVAEKVNASAAFVLVTLPSPCCVYSNACVFGAFRASCHFLFSR